MRPYEQIRDELLVLECLTGNRAALDELVGRWQERLFRHARRLTGSEEAAWDAVQETWVAVVASIRRLHEPSAFGRWVYTILGNKCADWVRRQQRERGLVGKVTGRETDGGLDEVRLSLWQALLQLPHDQRLVLLLYYVEDYSVREVARVLDIPEGTVKSRLHYARERLRGIGEVGNDG